MKRFVPAVLVPLLLAPPASAYFDRLEVGARALSMGKAYHALAEDPSAVYWNPAGLAWQRRAGVLLAHYRPYVVEDLAVNFAALAIPLPPTIGTAGIAWHHTGLSGVVAEDLFFLSLARRTRLAALGNLGIGMTAKVFRVSYRPFLDTGSAEQVDYGAQTKFAADFGAILQPTPRLRIGAIVRDIGEPEFDFVPGNGGTRIDVKGEGGLAYRWHDESVVSIGVATDRDGKAAPTAGGEVIFFDVFALRSGLFDFEYWGGFGILTRSWTLDAGFATHKALGVSYMMSVTVPFGRKR